MPSKDKLFQSIFHHEFSSPDAADILQKAVLEFPYFIPAHYYLLKKDPVDQHQAATTSLLFNNPLWLNSLLVNEEEKKVNDIIPFTSISTEIMETFNKERDQPVSEQMIADTLPVEINEVKVADKPDIKLVVKEDELIFEPLFASDYFASQGIKISDEIKPDDKLGRQLKSFTEWLKSMKKVEPAKTMDEVTPVDITVQHMAEKSNTEGEVLTETMAEVFAQQGKAAKAAEVYEKLSLLNPLKSAYFAAKIEQLKSN